MRRARSTTRLPVDRLAPDASTIDTAAAVLRRGGLVAFPTETVYGLGADALDADAVGGVFAAKGRPATDPVIVHIGAADDLQRVAAAVPTVAARLARAFWPGPLTLILPKREVVPAAVTAGLPTVAVRMPAHPVALALIQAAATPIAAPSANRFSRPSPTSADHVLADLDGAIDLVLDAGATDVGVESTIVDCTVEPPLVRRAGGVTLDALRAVVPTVIAASTDGSVDVAQVAPGQLLRHYAPSAAMTVYAGPSAAVVERLAADARSHAAAGRRAGVLAPDEVLTALAPSLAAVAVQGRIVVESLGPRGAAAQAAQRLFAALRRLDGAAVDVILASGPDRTGLGEAVWDRLRRAAEGRIVTVPAPGQRSKPDQSSR